MPVYVDGQEVDRLRGPDCGAALLRLCERFDGRESREVEVGLPVTTRYGTAGSVTVLWATTDTRASARHASRFRPAPSMVLKLGPGAKRILLWGLRESIPALLAEEANKRIAYKLRAPYRACDPDKLRLPVPGTCLRAGRRRPTPVLVTRLSSSAFNRSQVVYGLKDPPKPYVQRMRESGAWS